jgi:hypothetical protein
MGSKKLMFGDMICEHMSFLDRNPEQGWAVIYEPTIYVGRNLWPPFDQKLSTRVSVVVSK